MTERTYTSGTPSDLVRDPLQEETIFMVATANLDLVRLIPNGSIVKMEHAIEDELNDGDIAVICLYNQSTIVIRDIENIENSDVDTFGAFPVFLFGKYFKNHPNSLYGSDIEHPVHVFTTEDTFRVIGKITEFRRYFN